MFFLTFLTIILLLSFNFSVVIYKKIANKYKFISYPKPRDSHIIEVVKGAGIIFFLFIFIYSFIIQFWTEHKSILYQSILLLTPIITLISFIDDKININWKIKILFDLITVIMITLFFYEAILSNHNFLIQIIIIFSLLWFINLINFIDGSDGYLTTVLILSLLSNLLTKYFFHDEFIFFQLLIILLLFNFLFYNFPPASIFLGDSGSRFFAVLLIIFFINDILKYNHMLVFIWFGSLQLIITDTCYTLIFRLLTKNNWMSEHKEHAYQLLTNYYGHKISIYWLILNTGFIFLPSLILFYYFKIHLLIIIVLSLILYLSQIIYIKHLLHNKI